jgi:hypothetical protein
MVGRKTRVRSGHCSLTTAIRAGFEPFRALGSPIRSGILGKAKNPTPRLKTGTD